MLLIAVPAPLARAWAKVTHAHLPVHFPVHLRGEASAANVKAAVIGAVFLLLFLVVLACLDPQSAVRRAADAHAAKLDERLRVLRKEPAGLRITAIQALAMLGVVTLTVQLGEPALALLALVIGAGPYLYLEGAVNARRRAIEEQVHGFALNLANTMRTTANVGDALRMAGKITERPLGEEIEVMLAQMSLGGSLEEALEALAKRVNVLALDVLVTALLIGRKTGGDLPRLMETTAASLREIHRLEAFAAKVMADPKRTFAVMSVAPPVGFVGVKRLLPMIVDPFLATASGQQVLASCAAAYVLCVVVGWKFVRVDV